MTCRAVRAFFAGVLALSIGLTSAAAAASAPEAPQSKKEDSPETRAVKRIASATFEGARTIAVEVHRNWPYPDWLDLDLLDRGDSVVVSIVEESNPDSRWEIVAIPRLVLLRHGDVQAINVKAIHADSVVLELCDAMYRIYCTSIKTFFDAKARKALGRVEFELLDKSRLLEIGNAVYAVTERERFGRSPDNAIVARYAPGEPVLVSGAESKAAIATLPRPPAECQTLRGNLIREDGRLVPSKTPLTRPSCFEQAASSPPLWTFDFPLGSFDAREGYEYPSGIAVQDGESYLAYPLPQSTPEDLGRYRRGFEERHAAYTRDVNSYTIRESIDAFALEADRLWFGKSFYDGEGYTGVGSLGYFDIERRNYVFVSLPEITDWSTSAILVEEGAVWIGLTDHPEGAARSGGLLRYDRTSGETRIYPIEDVTTQLLGHNGLIYVGAEKGRVYVIKEDSIVSRYSVEPALEGGFEIRSLPLPR